MVKNPANIYSLSIVLYLSRIEGVSIILQQLPRVKMRLSFYTCFILCFYYNAAFLPDYVPGSDARSEYHTSITRYALKRIAIQFFNEQTNRPNGSHQIPNIHDIDDSLIFSTFYGTKKASPDNFVRARTYIASQNKEVDTDRATKNDPRYHFDAEMFQEANSVVRETRQKIISSIASQNFSKESIWTYLGQALHTIQDFYSHSNWVELGKTKPIRGIGDTDGNPFSHINIAQHDTLTCKNCPVDTANPKDCSSNILPNILAQQILTSGYRSDQYLNGRQIQKPAGKNGEGKCSHGGRKDSTRYEMATGGISKDSPSCKEAPHCANHFLAAQMAEDASVIFLHDLREDIGDKKLGDILGLFIGKSLVVALDTTGSMESYIQAAKNRIANMVEQSVQSPEFAIANFVLVPFNDPDVGPVLITRDPNEFLDAVNKLDAQGGGDCPEMSLTGILKAAQSCEPNSPIAVFTNSDEKDSAKLASVLSIAGSKHLTISFYGYQQCTGIQSAAYNQIASSTGGFVFTATGDLLYESTSYMEETIDSSSVNLLHLNGSLGDVTRYFYIEGGVEKITITTTSETQLPNLEVSDPTGTVQACKSTVNLPTTKTCRILNPIAGKWTVNVRSARSNQLWTALISASSTLETSCTMLTENVDSDEPFFAEVVGNPIAGSVAFLECTVSDSNANLSFASIFSESGMLLFDLPLIYQGNISKIYLSNFTVPAAGFYYGVSGFDSSDLLFTRVSLSKYYPSYINLNIAHVSNVSFAIARGDSFVIVYNVSNFGGSSSFDILVSDSLGFLRSFTPKTAILGPNSNIEVTAELYVPSTAVAGSATRVTLTVQNHNDLTEANSIQEFLYIVDNIVDTMPPFCNITQNTIQTSCDSTSVNNPELCKHAFWYSSFSFGDIDSGLSSIVTSSSDGSVQWNLPSDYERKPSEIFVGNSSGSCCVQYSSLRVVDMTGKRSECSITNPFIITSTSFPVTTGTSTAS